MVFADAHNFLIGFLRHVAIPQEKVYIGAICLNGSRLC